MMEITDNRLSNMLAYAQKIMDDTIPLDELASIFEEMFAYRTHYERWIGETSGEYKLANNLSALSRIYRNTRESNDGVLSAWLAKHPLHMEWFSRIQSAIDSIKTDDIFTN